MSPHDRYRFGLRWQTKDYAGGDAMWSMLTP